jgi:drug/metabolite transporter (DMT)-like permease
LFSGFAFSWMMTLTPLANQGCGWQLVAIFRCTIPLVVVTAWACWDGAKLTLGTPVLWIRSLAGSCSLVATFYALTHLPVTEVSAVSNIFPIWIALLSWPILGQFPGPLVWVSIACSVAGVFVLQGAQLQAGDPSVLVVVVASMFTAVAMMGLNRLRDLDPRAIVVHFSATALMFAIASYFIFPAEPAKAPFDWTHLAELIGVGLAASMGQYGLTRAFTAGDPAKVSVASLSQFAMIFVLDIVVLGNSIDMDRIWGIPLILGPTLWLMAQRPATVMTVSQSESSSSDEWAIDGSADSINSVQCADQTR